MNKRQTLFALAIGSTVTVVAQAAPTPYSNSMTTQPQPYVGVKVGQYDLDDADDEATLYGVYVGAKFSPSIGLEAEYLTTNDEDFDNRREYNADVYGVYGTYDYTFPGSQMYAKGRFGYAKHKLEVDTKNSSFKSKASERGLAGGLGLGYNIAPNASVEMAYDWYPSIDKASGGELDANAITLGAHFKF